MFLSVSYDIKYQRVARKHMATSRDKEHSRASSSAHTLLQQLAAASSHCTQHSNFQQHTRSSTSTKTKSCHNKELSQQRAVKTHSQCSSLSEFNFSKLDIL